MDDSRFQWIAEQVIKGLECTLEQCDGVLSLDNHYFEVFDFLEKDPGNNSI